MLSNPRSVTTALERSFMERGDMEVVHEPWACLFWALRGSGEFDCQLPEWISSQRSFAEMRDQLLRRAKERMLFIKDFSFSTHPLLEDTSFLADPNVKFIFLIRHPKPVIASYYRKMNDFEPFCVDYAGLVALFEAVWQAKGMKPPVIESEELLKDPEGVLRGLCQAIDIPFTEKMLGWEKGMLPMWSHLASWHKKAAESTSFQLTEAQEDPFEGIPEEDLPPLEELLEKSLPNYHKLKST
ncbi:MAG: hypothetical protein KDK65_06175 [Chlamydiia bacterium]|nr:hypothetical protein [Chlamydiia bacterium]